MKADVKLLNEFLANQISSVYHQFSCSVTCDCLQPHGLQHARPPCPSPTSGVFSNSMSIASVIPSSHLILCHPLLLPPSIFPSISGSFQMSHFFASGGQRLEFQLQHQSFQKIFRTDLLYDGLVGSPCSPRHSQESSPTPQFKSINSLVLSFLYSPTLISKSKKTNYKKDSASLTKWGLYQECKVGITFKNHCNLSY